MSVLVKDPAQLVDRLKRGETLTREEVAFVRARLHSAGPNDDVYDLVRALALAVPATAKDVELVEPYLLNNDDDWTLQGAIYALCDYWELTERYVGRLAELVTREAWEEYSDASIAAIGALGDHAFSKDDPKAYRILLGAYEEQSRAFSEERGDFDALRFGCVYRALDVAFRGRDALRDHIKDKTPSEVDERVIEHARRRAGS